MSRRILFFLPGHCSGCKRCEMACSLQTAGECNPAQSLLRALVHPQLGTPSLLLDDRCIGCAACVRACNREALRYTSEEDWGDLLEAGWAPVPVLPHDLATGCAQPEGVQ